MYNNIKILNILILIIFISTSLEIDNCIEEVDVCTQCITGYTLVETNSGSECIEENKLKQIQNTIENCIDMNETSKKCNKCKREYIPSYNNLRCIHMPYCSRVNINNECSFCMDSYTLNEIECIKNPPCRIMKDGECSLCADYYYLDWNDNNSCKRLPFEHCIFGNSDYCKECEKYYYINDNGRCNIIGIKGCEEGDDEDCTKCSAGYYLGRNDYNLREECKEYPEHCTNFDDNEYKCKSCEIGYYPYYSRCERGINNCDYGNSTICKKCKEGYYYYEYECFEIPVKNCKTYNYDGESGICKECEKGFYLNNNKCSEIPIKNCVTYNKESGLCQYCDYGYYLDNNQCMKYLIDNCNSYAQNICSSCKSGFALNNQKTSCVELCKSKEKKCKKCENLYGTFDYGKTCSKLSFDSSYNINNKGMFIEINIFIIYLILFLFV